MKIWNTETPTFTLVLVTGVMIASFFATFDRFPQMLLPYFLAVVLLLSIVNNARIRKRRRTRTDG